MANSKFRCSYCKKYFPAYMAIKMGVVRFCSESHMFKYVNEHSDKLIGKGQEIKRKAENAKKREDKKKLRPKGWYVKKAQEAFNWWIRECDHALECISCGDPNPPNIFGGQWDCGHYLTIGAHPELRFHPLNAHKQCKSCNGGAGKYGKFHKKEKTIQDDYRDRLIERIGLGSVEYLEGPHKALHLSIDDLEWLAKHYRKAARLEIAKRQ